MRLKLASDEVAGFALRNIDCRACRAARGNPCTATAETYVIPKFQVVTRDVCLARLMAAHTAMAFLARRERRDLAERDSPRTLTRPDGTVITARMTRADGVALVRFMTALAIGQPPGAVQAARVMRLWDEGILTADEMDEAWRLATRPERPSTEHDRFPQWDVILSGFETSRPRH